MPSFADMAQQLMATGEGRQSPDQAGVPGGGFGGNRPANRPSGARPGYGGWSAPEVRTPTAAPSPGALAPPAAPSAPQAPGAAPMMPPPMMPPPMASPDTLAGMFQMLIGGQGNQTPGAQMPPVSGGGLPGSGVPLPSVQPGNAFDAMAGRYGAAPGQPTAPVRTF